MSICRLRFALGATPHPLPSLTAWYMADDVPAGEAQKLEQRLRPNKPVGAASLEELGIYYWNVPPDEWAHLYPPISVPWDPAEAKDPKLVEIREERGYR